MTFAVRSRHRIPGPFPALLAIVACFGACAKQPTERATRPVSRSMLIRFRYPLVDGRGSLDDDGLRGRPSLITFVTTYDLASQAQVRFLSGVARRRVPRINAAVVILEPVTNAPLVLAFADTLHVPYPVAWGDAEMISGGGPFGDVHAVPSTILLDREGRLAWKRVGLAKEEELMAALEAL